MGSSPTGLPAAARGAVTVGAAMTQFVRAPDAAAGLSVRVSDPDLEPDTALVPDASEPSPPWSVAAHPVRSSASDATSGPMTRRFTRMTRHRPPAELCPVAGNHSSPMYRRA